MQYLQHINSPDDLKKLSIEQLETVCRELEGIHHRAAFQ